ncbi:hypothetical protein [Prosthecobacter sp.]|uniref:hypothetical protein n=1 Tax=Prosthecobacter sp. TaxID=1965333 RepID=UPI002AB8ED18|nr:hypothetical protein [Prosthecobacter sp.]MDZ4403650.1 hypothetical protein [Prosthecobacter sp.]
MQPILLSTGVDPFQMAIIVIAVIAGFIKWLWENWQLKREAAQRTPPDPEEQRLREAAWRKQTGQGGPPPLPPPAAPSAWDELRKAWKELQETARQTQAPVPPPQPASRPPPVQQQRQRPVRTSAPVAPPSPVAAASTTPAPVMQENNFPQQKQTTPKVSVLAAVHNLRRDPALMRQAILMQEILGPPKALQSSADFAI